MFNLTTSFAGQESLVCFDGDEAQSENDVSSTSVESVPEAGTPGGSNSPFNRDSSDEQLLTGK